MSERSIVHATFTLERSYPAPVSQVYRAWAAPQIKVRWFAGNPADYELDFRPGGSERNGAVLDGKRITWEAVYREIVPDERIVYTGVLSEDETVATLSLTTVEFVAEGDGTRLVLVEAGAFLDGREQPAWREQGTADWLDALGRHLVAIRLVRDWQRAQHMLAVIAFPGQVRPRDGEGEIRQAAEQVP